MTNFAVVKKLTFFGGSTRIDNFHYAMFHGLAERRNSSNRSAYFLGEPLDVPLSVQTNAYRQCHIVQPEVSLLISEQVRHELGAVNNVAFLPTVLRKAFIIPYEASNFSHWDDIDYQDDGEEPNRIISKADHHPELALEMLPLFEVVCAKYEDVKYEFSNLSNVEVKVGPTIYDADIRLELSNQILCSYPIMWHCGCHIISEDIFRKLRKYFDWDYFIVKELSM